MNEAAQPIAAVCGSQVRIYGPLNVTRRPLLRVIEFPHRGAALNYAQEHDDRNKPAQPKRA